MSFRLKLGITFCSVLLLTITVALTSWWGMGTALQRQNTILTFSLDVDRLLNTLNHQEHLFNANQDMAHAIAVTDLLKQLTAAIEEVQQFPRRSQQQLVAKILDNLGLYHRDFTLFSGQMIGMETMKSRMIQESARLLSHTRNLADEGSPIAATILQQISLMLQAEKDYMLFGTTKAANTVRETVVTIEKMTKQATGQARDETERLQTFRISKVAAIYQIIFADYLDEQQNLKEKMQRMHSSSEHMASELRRFVDFEQAEVQKQVNTLKVLTIAVSLSAIALALVITVVVATWITRPLEQLKKSATAIINGDLTTTVTIKSHDEIGQVGIIFNQMILKLRKSFEDIRQYREHLEELVAKRTLLLLHPM